MDGEGIPVLAAGQIQGYFSSRSKQPAMTAQLIQQIVHQLDQKCRDVSSRLYVPANETKGIAAAG